MTKLLNLALTQIGIKEWKGTNHNPEIIKYFKETGFDSKRITDETAWCSAAMNWLCAQLDIERSNKLDARSWLTVGKKAKRPQAGDIVILWRENKQSWKGHVGIFIRKDHKHIYILGGNQSNEYKISAYPKNRLLEYRRIDIPQDQPKTIEVIKEVEVIKTIENKKKLTEYTAAELISAFLAVIFRNKKKKK